MIHRDEVLKLHEYTIVQHGGLPGVRDEEALSSALQRPFASFLNQPLYKSNEEKASAILESIIKERPFEDGNKRVGYLTYRLMLRQGGQDIAAGEEEKFTFLQSVEDAKMKYGEIRSWTQEHLVDLVIGADHKV